MSNTPIPINLDAGARRAFALHDRVWQSNRYIYPVISRRSKGLSIGVNLNPDKVCNFDCIYCSVDRKLPGPPKEIDLPQLRTELANMLQLALSGELFKHDPFDKIPAALQRINDIAFSGDGEPTTAPEFPEACQIAAELAETLPKDFPLSPLPSPLNLKLVVITNATMFHRPAVQAALAFLDQHHGEIWAKLDAGTAAYYDLVDRTPVPFQRVLDNILTCAQARPTVIQTLLMRVHNAPPPAEEIAAYIGRLRAILAAGGRLQLVQLYTVARTTTEPYATPLTSAELEQIATTVRTALPTLPVEVYP